MDWNRDGKLDILSGCYWSEGANAGHIHILYGAAGIEFKAAEPLLNEDGKPLENIVISKAEYESGAGQESITEAICTHQFLADVDGDGDLDLVNGCFGSSFYYFENKGSDEEPKLAAEAVLLPIKSPDYHAAPHLVDWDNDGDLDLITGGGGGGVYLSLNEGSATEPNWGEFRQIIPKSNLHEQIVADDSEIKPGPSTRVWAYDFNGDGLLDLIVGDSTSIVSPAAGLTRDEFEAKEKAHQQNVEAHGKQFQEVFQRYQTAQENLKDGEEIDAEIEEEFNAAREEFMKLRQAREEWCKSQSTGHVWVYLRKAPTEASMKANGQGEPQ